MPQSLRGHSVVPVQKVKLCTKLQELLCLGDAKAGKRILGDNPTVMFVAERKKYLYFSLKMPETSLPVCFWPLCLRHVLFGILNVLYRKFLPTDG